MRRFLSLSALYTWHILCNCLVSLPCNWVLGIMRLRSCEPDGCEGEVGVPGCDLQCPHGSRWGRKGREERGGRPHVPASSVVSRRSYQLPAIAARQLCDQGPFMASSCSALPATAALSLGRQTNQLIAVGEEKKKKRLVGFALDGASLSLKLVNDEVTVTSLDLIHCCRSLVLQQLWNVKFPSYTCLVCSECRTGSIVVRVCVSTERLYFHPSASFCLGPITPQMAKWATDQ